MISISETTYKKISLPESLISSVKKFRENNKHLGYTSDVDVIKDAIRDKIFTVNDEIVEIIVK